MFSAFKTRRAASNIGRLYGIKRRWFGLEPEPWYRARLIRVLECNRHH
jgi:hypothetical protein